jgi:hypothetical protein
MADIFEQRRTSIDEHVTRLTVLDDQIGAIFAVDSQVVGMELFDDPQTCGKLMPKLVRSYALGAIRERPGNEDEKSRIRDVTDLLNALGSLDPKRFPAVGLGEDWRMGSDHVDAAAIVHDGRAIHLCAFAISPARGKMTAGGR